MILKCLNASDLNSHIEIKKRGRGNVKGGGLRTKKGRVGNMDRCGGLEKEKKKNVCG